MTNDRRKTFNTPLEFWQWAIMEPGKRKARVNLPTADVVHLQETLGGGFFVCNSSGYPTGDMALIYPLTAVEDEHGVIPEPEPELRHPKTMLGEVANWLEDIAVCKDEGDRLGSSKQAAKFIQLLIREEIAAATVEYHQAHTNEWSRLWNHRLKPKGDA